LDKALTGGLADPLKLLKPETGGWSMLATLGGSIVKIAANQLANGGDDATKAGNIPASRPVNMFAGLTSILGQAGQGGAELVKMATKFATSPKAKAWVCDQAKTHKITSTTSAADRSAKLCTDIREKSTQRGGVAFFMMLETFVPGGALLKKAQSLLLQPKMCEMFFALTGKKLQDMIAECKDVSEGGDVGRR